MNDPFRSYDAWKTTETWNPYDQEDEMLDRQYQAEQDREHMDATLIRAAKLLAKDLLQPDLEFSEAWPLALTYLQEVAREAARVPGSVRQFETREP